MNSWREGLAHLGIVVAAQFVCYFWTKYLLSESASVCVCLYAFVNNKKICTIYYYKQ